MMVVCGSGSIAVGASVTKMDCSIGSGSAVSSKTLGPISCLLAAGNCCADDTRDVSLVSCSGVVVAAQPSCWTVSAISSARHFAVGSTVSLAAWAAGTCAVYWLGARGSLGEVTPVQSLYPLCGDLGDFH